MSLLDYLDDLRGKPDHIKRGVVFVVTVIITVVIAALWMAFGIDLGDKEKIEADNVLNEPTSPLEMLSQDMKDAFGYIKQGIDTYSEESE